MIRRQLALHRQRMLLSRLHIGSKEAWHVKVWVYAYGGMEPNIAIQKLSQPCVAQTIACTYMYVSFVYLPQAMQISTI